MTTRAASTVPRPRPASGALRPALGLVAAGMFHPAVAFAAPPQPKLPAPPAAPPAHAAAAPDGAPARSRMLECGHQWSNMKHAGTASGTWKDFSRGCLAQR